MRVNARISGSWLLRVKRFSDCFFVLDLLVSPRSWPHYLVDNNSQNRPGVEQDGIPVSDRLPADISVRLNTADQTFSPACDMAESLKANARPGGSDASRDPSIGRVVLDQSTRQPLHCRPSILLVEALHLAVSGFIGNDTRLYPRCFADHYSMDWLGRERHTCHKAIRQALVPKACRP